VERVKIIEPVKQCDRKQVELLYRDIDILRAELDDLRAWKGKALREVESLLELAQDNAHCYIQAKVRSARGEEGKERDMIYESKVAARANENQYWVNRIEAVLLKIK
jgi:hypothetical protein